MLAAAGGLSFHLDRLGAVFLAVIGGVTIPVAIYGFGYTGGYGRRYSMRWMSLQTGAFLLSMSLVVSAANVLTFLLAWELMAVTSWLLVITEHDRPDAVRGGLWYLAMTHMGLLALLAAFFLLGGDQPGAWPFDALRDGAAVSPRERATRFSSWPCSVSARRPASCPCTSGCRAPIQPRQATCRPSCRR